MTTDDLLAATLARRYCRSGEARRLREGLSVGVRETALALNVDASTLSRWERGLTAPTNAGHAVKYGRLIAVWLRASEAAGVA
jgi:DNA-binding transcriptional regulator YiaG